MQFNLRKPRTIFTSVMLTCAVAALLCLILFDILYHLNHSPAPAYTVADNPSTSGIKLVKNTPPPGVSQTDAEACSRVPAQIHDPALDEPYHDKWYVSEPKYTRTEDMNTGADG